MFQNFKVIVNTAAGRRRYMQYLVPYVLASDVVDRYDIWINTHNGADIEFFKRLASAFPKVNLCWQPDGWVKGNASINAFYKQCCDEDAIYFKLDDDICWMETDAIEKMVRYRVEHPEYFLVTPLVINNAQSTYLLQVAEKIKLNKYYNAAASNPILWKSGDFALQLHQWFLKHLRNKTYQSLYVGSHPTAMCRFSINAIMWFGRDLAKFGGIVTGDDEETMSCILPTQMGGVNSWNGDAIMAHFAFFTQRKQLDACNILDQYGEYCKQQFVTDPALNDINNTVQRIMGDIALHEEELMKQPSPYLNYNPNIRISTGKQSVKRFVPKLIWEWLRRKHNETKIYIIEK